MQEFRLILGVVAATALALGMLTGCGPTAMPNVQIGLPSYPLPSPAATSTGPVVRVQPFVDRVTRPHGGTLTVFDMSLGNIVFDPQIATVLEDAVVAELSAAGMKVVLDRDDVSPSPAADFLVTGAIDEFVVSTTNSMIDWDVKLEMRVCLGLFREDGTSVRTLPPVSAILDEKTMARPGGEIIGRLALRHYARFREALSAPEGLIPSIRNAAAPSARKDGPR